MSTLTSSLLEDATLTSLENDTIQDGMIEDLFSPANFSETETCAEIMGANRSSRGASRSHVSRRSNNSSSVASRKPKEQKSNARNAFNSAPGAMSPVDDEIANMVREDVRKMIATVRSAKAQQPPKSREDEGKDAPTEKKMLVRPGKYGECDRSPRKQMLKKIRKEKLKKKTAREEIPSDEDREDRSQKETTAMSQKSVESMKKGYYKNLRQYGPEQVTRSVGVKGKEVGTPEKNKEVPTSTASVSKSISSRRSHLSKTQAKNGSSVATSKSQSKIGEVPKTPLKAFTVALEPGAMPAKTDKTPKTTSIDPKKSNTRAAPINANDAPLSGSSVAAESQAKSVASASGVEAESQAKTSVAAESQAKSVASASGVEAESQAKTSVAAESQAKSVASASGVEAESQAKSVASASAESSAISNSPSKNNATFTVPAPAIINESSVASKSHKKSVSSGSSVVVFKDQVTTAPLASFEDEGTNKSLQDETDKEGKKKDTESIVLPQAQTAMTESETRPEEDSVLTGSVVYGRGDLTDTEEDDTEDHESTRSSPTEEFSHQRSMSTISYRMTQVEASKEVDVSEEIECVLGVFHEIKDPIPSIKPDPSAVLDSPGQQKEVDAGREIPQERGAAPPGEKPDEKNKKVAPGDSSTTDEKESGEGKNLRGQEAPARSSRSLIASMQDEEDCTLEEVSEEEPSEEDAGETTTGETSETTSAETNAAKDKRDEKQVDDSARLKQLKIENAKLKNTLNFLQKTAVEKEKYFAELAWFGKRSEEEVQKWRPNFWRERLQDLGPELFEEFRADAMRIADPDVGDWEHGFSSGSLAMARLLLGLSHAVDDEKICVYHDPGQPCGLHCVTCSVADQRKRELADFPVLDP